MHLCISIFLCDSAEDSSLKYELDVDSAFNDQIVQLLGHKKSEPNGQRRMAANCGAGSADCFIDQSANSKRP